MACSGGVAVARKMKVTSWEVVVVVVIGTESSVVGSICNYDTISIISIISIIIISIIIMMMIIIICNGDGRDSGWMIRSLWVKVLGMQR